MTHDAGWHQIITAFPRGVTTVAYKHESGEWTFPDPDFNDASLVGARVTRMYTEAEIQDALERPSTVQGIATELEIGSEFTSEAFARKILDRIRTQFWGSL